MADAVTVRPSARGARLRLRVKPGGRRDRLLGAHAGALKLEVRAAPERGKANAAVERLLAGSLEVTAAVVAVVAGAGSRDKVLEISGLSASEVAERLLAAGVDAAVEEGQKR